MGKIEGRYLGVEHGEGGSDDDDDEERIEESNQNDEWFGWTSNIVFLAEKLNRDVDKITSMSYQSFLFWINYFKLKIEDDYRNNQTR